MLETAANVPWEKGLLQRVNRRETNGNDNRPRPSSSGTCLNAQRGHQQTQQESESNKCFNVITVATGKTIFPNDEREEDQPYRCQAPEPACATGFAPEYRN